MNHESAIIHLYQTLVGRDPDAAGFQYWLGEMDAGRVTQGALVEALIKSDEFLSVQDGLVRLYKAAFGRVPDKAGLDYWVGKIEAGEHNLQDVSTLFITSPEFEQRFGSSVSTDFVVTKMYQNTFGREPDVAGFHYWVEQVNNGLTISDLLLNFTESSEGVATLEDYVSTVVLYDRLVSRMPTSAEVLQAPMTATAVADTIIAKDEYLGPDPAQPESALIGTFADGTLTLSGTATGLVVVDQVAQRLTEGGFALSVTDFDWDALTTIDVAEITEFPVSVVGTDSALEVVVGAMTQSVSLGSADDTVTLEAVPTRADFVLDPGLGSNTLNWSTSLSVDASGANGTYGFFSVINGSEFNDTLTLLRSDLALTIDALGGTDTLRLVGGGTVNVPELSGLSNIEAWEFSDGSVYDFIGADDDDYVTTGSGGGRLLGGGGADTFHLSSGSDLVAFSAITDSQQDTSSVEFTGDLIHGFDFSEDQFELPVTIDGSITNNLTIASAFHSNLVSILASDANVSVALTSDISPDIDALLVEVLAGGAVGHYLIVQATAKDTGFNAATDLIVKLVGATNTTGFDFENILT